MRTRLAVIAGLLWLLAAAPASANGDEGGAGGTDCVARAVEVVQRHYEKIHDLRARFEQTTHSVALGGGGPGAVTTSRGSVAFAKPGRMRWSYEEPEPSLVLSDGHTLSLYDPSRGELQRMPVGEGFLSGAAIQFLLGRGDILREFEVTALACEPDAFELELVPREPATYERLRLRIAANGDVLRTEVVDLLGNRTEVSFRDIETDFGPPADFFSFEPPPGVRVIEIEPPDAATGS